MSKTETAVEQDRGPVGDLPGAMLRAAREGRNLSAAQIADMLHLTESAVSSLEADRYQDLPGVTFVRGYMRSYAKLVGLDPDAVASHYTQTTQTEPVRPLPDLGRTVARSRSRGKWAMGLLLVLLLAGLSVGYLWWQEEQGLSTQSAPPFRQVEVERVDGSLYIQSLDQLDAQTAELEVAEITLDSLQPATRDVEGDASVETDSEQPADAPVSPAEQTLADANADTTEHSTVVEGGQHQLQLTFNDECWIRITDGSGKELASGLHQAGDSLQLSGDAPFELHLGNAKGIQLQFNGQPVDIRSSIKGNVARIKLG